VECSADDCAWGGLKDQKEIQDANEQFVEFFKDGSEKLIEITDDWRKDKPLYYTVYKKELNLKQNIVDFADTTHKFYYYPVRWGSDEEIFDDYETHGVVDSLLNFIAKTVLYLSVLITFLSLGYVVYLLVKN
jgi:hypothetical protein